MKIDRKEASIGEERQADKGNRFYPSFFVKQ